MGNQIIQSIKTIAQSLVDKAGYDKTRGGFIVGVNSVTNTYSVKIDGVTYPIVRAVDGATYNVGDVVKVVIPCNQATQMYISSSILSDNSLGNKIANATTLAEDAKKLGLDNQVEIKDVSDVANSKNKTFRQNTAPTEGMSSGDVWIDTSDNNTLYVYDGTQWVFSGGGNGQDGLNNATILLYKRGETAPDKPTAEVTYTFADASLSPTSALNGWSQAIPEIDGNPCWVIAATASATTATDTIGVSEWSTQIKFVEDGVQGLNQATIFLYSRTTSTKPSSPTTYTFASGMLSPLPSGWSRSVPTNKGDPCYVTTAIAIGRGSDTTITADAWSDPTVLVENGADGYSPTVSTGTSSDGSTTITVTNKDGSTTTELVDGTAREDATNAAKVATNFIGYDSTNGLIIGNKTSGTWSGYHSQILSDRFNILDESSTVLASFGTTTVIGEEANANLHLTFNNFSMVDKNDNKFFEVGDNRNADGIATMKHTETVTVNSAGSATVTVDTYILSIISVYADSVQLSSSSYSFSQKDVTINNLTANSQTSIEITYTTDDPSPYLTFGKRDSSGKIGRYSVAEGQRIIASGQCSHAEGSYTEASGSDSHAEGNATNATGYCSHAEGVFSTASAAESHAEGYDTKASGEQSHAEGYSSKASGKGSHAEGRYSEASGEGSHAGGRFTVADGNYMTAIGKYNTRNSSKAFAIGNGTSDKARSDAFAVDWKGNIYMSLGDCTITDSGTALSVTSGASTLDGLVAQSIIDTFSYTDAKEILGDENINVKKLLQKIVEKIGKR